MRKMSVAMSVVLLLLLFVLGQGSAWAAACKAMSLAEFGSANCEVGDIHFTAYGSAYDGFVSSGVSYTSGNWYYHDLSKITVTPFVNGSAQGFVFTGMDAVSLDTQVSHYMLEFNEASVNFMATALTGTIKGMSTSVSGTLRGNGLYDPSIAQEYSLALSAYLLCGTDNPWTPCPTIKGLGQATQYGGFPDGSDYTTYRTLAYPFGPSTGYGTLYMKDSVIGVEVTAYASLDSATYTFNTPEPSFVVLFGAGLAAVAGTIRRKKIR